MSGSFVFYESFFEAIEKLPKAKRYLAYKKIGNYALNGIEPTEAEKENWSDVVFLMAKPQIDANRERKENGSKGGRPKNEYNDLENEKSEITKKETIGLKNKKPSVIKNENHRFEKNKPNVNVNVNENENENENKNVNVNVNEGTHANFENENKTNGLEDEEKNKNHRFPNLKKNENELENIPPPEISNSTDPFVLEQNFKEFLKAYDYQNIANPLPHGKTRMSFCEVMRSNEISFNDLKQKAIQYRKSLESVEFQRRPDNWLKDEDWLLEWKPKKVSKVRGQENDVTNYSNLHSQISLNRPEFCIVKAEAIQELSDEEKEKARMMRLKASEKIRSLSNKYAMPV